MKRILQPDVVANLAAQVEGGGRDLSHADLSSIEWEGLAVAGATIAMSLFRNARFAPPQGSNGCTWIGNRIEDCRFEKVDMAKVEWLDCKFERCTLQSLRLIRTNLSRMAFSSCHFGDVDFSQAILIGTHFTRCSFVNVRFAGDQIVSGKGDLEFGPYSNNKISQKS